MVSLGAPTTSEYIHVHVQYVQVLGGGPVPCDGLKDWQLKPLDLSIVFTKQSLLQHNLLEVLPGLIEIIS